MTIYAGPGRWLDITDDWIDRDSDLADAERLMREGRRLFYVRCGGCPWGEQFLAPLELLEDFPMPGLMGMRGWQADPLRCRYCLGTEKRPDDPGAAPYPVAGDV